MGHKGFEFLLGILTAALIAAIIIGGGQQVQETQDTTVDKAQDKIVELLQ